MLFIRFMGCVMTCVSFLSFFPSIRVEKNKSEKKLNLSDLEGNQGWWEGHRKSQETPDLLEG